MYFESNWSHKKGEKKKKRLGDWTKANKHAVKKLPENAAFPEYGIFDWAESFFIGFLPFSHKFW